MGSVRRFTFGRNAGTFDPNLLMRLDASNVLSYNPSIGGTDWKDVSGNAVDSVLRNTVNYVAENGGSFNFNSNSFADTANLTISADKRIPSELLGDATYSVMGWFKLNANQTNKSTWGFGSPDTAENINSFMLNQNEISISLSNVAVIKSDVLYSLNQYQHIVWVKRAGTFDIVNCDIYVNGVLSTLSFSAGGGGTLPNITRVTGGGAPVGIALANSNSIITTTQKSDCRISEFSIYKKALNQSEVTANFNLTKTRFGL